MLLLIAGFIAVLAILVLFITIRERIDLARFAERTAGAWDAEFATLQLSHPGYEVVLNTSVPPVEVIQALDYFLQSSDWGDWNLDSGGPSRGHYRRGIWIGNPPDVERNFFNKYLFSHRHAEAYPAPDAQLDPSTAVAHGYRIWPLTLEISLRPVPGIVTLKSNFRSSLMLGPHVQGIDAFTDAEPYRRNRCRLIDYYSRCIAAEMEDLAAYLATALRLSQRPQFRRQ